jgi:toxin FitB
VYLLDTNIVSELRKGARADPGVRKFFADASTQRLFLSVITIGELRKGVERLRNRGDAPQAKLLEDWLGGVLEQYEESILPFDQEVAQLWAYMLARAEQNPIDKQLAATALLYGLTLVTRNVRHVRGTGVIAMDPFAG